MLTENRRKLIIITHANKIVETIIRFQNGESSIGTLSAEIKIQLDDAIEQALNP